MTAYQKRLLAFLSVATFFEGYDFFALTQLLPNLRAEMGFSAGAEGWLVAVINFGTVVAYLVIGRVDRWGRRSVLTATILGYTCFTLLSAAAPNVWAFGLAQMIARVFLIGEWATSNVIAAEEFSAARRGTVIGVISAFSGLGSVICAGVVPLLLKTPLGWRSVYLVGVAPLLIVAYARRNLKETERFAAGQRAAAERAAAGVVQSRPSLLAILATPYRRRVFQLGAIWFLTYLCSQNAITFWKEFAMNERGMTDADVGRAITFAALASMVLVFFTGPLLDAVGRRVGAMLIFSSLSFGVFGCYTFHSPWALRLALLCGVFGVSAFLPVMNSFNAELFPTELRGSAYAWANNIIGRVGYVLSPIAVGLTVQRLGWGATLRTTALFPLAALLLIVTLLPETRGRELERTAEI